MNAFDFDGNRHGLWVEKNPDGSIKRQGQYIHGQFYTGLSRQKKNDPVRHDILRALSILSKLSLPSAQARGRLKHTQQSLALLYQSIQQNKR